MKPRTPHLYLFLVLLVSLPFYAFGDRALLPAGMPYIPAAALMVLVPAAVAFALCIWQGGLVSARALAMRAFESPKKRSAVWLIPATAALPCIMLITATLFPAGAPPASKASALGLSISVGLLLAFAVAEEIGWTGYALDALQERFSPAYASVVIGLTWSAWHWAPWYTLHGSIEWIFWQTLLNVLLRAWSVHMYNESDKNIIVVCVFHASFNVGFGALAFIEGAYDPMMILLAVSALTCLVFGVKRLCQSALLRLRRT